MQRSKDDEIETEEVVVLTKGNNSKTGQLDDDLHLKLLEAFDKPSMQLILHEVSKIALEYDSVDLAHAVNRLPKAARVALYECLPDLNAKIIFMTNTGSSTRAAIFAETTDGEILEILDALPLDEAVWLIEDLSSRRRKRILEKMDSKRAARLRELFEQDSNSAGRLMTSDFFAFHWNKSLGEVAKIIRESPGIDLNKCIFVLSDEDELIGFVPVRSLIVNPIYISLRQVMRPVVHKINAEATRDEVVDLVERYKIPALPVVDDADRLLGVISYETVVEVLEEIADETIASFAGTREDVSEHQPTFQRFLNRAPWLVVTLCAGFVTATALSYFRDLHWFNFVALFVPLIAGMSGNVGIQCSTVLVRGMSTGELSHGTRKRAVLNELCIGLLIGTVFGIACGTVVYIINQWDIHYMGSEPLMLGIVVSCGLFGACMVASLLGTLFPFIFARMKVDPAIASGPIVTAFNDVLSTLMYIFIAKAITSFFELTTL